MDGNSKLLVTTGYEFENGRKSEILDLLNPDVVCEDLNDFRYDVRYATGGIIDNDTIIVCGGEDSSGYKLDSCSSLDGSVQDLKLIHPRYASSSIVYNDLLWVTGGWPETRTSEFVEIGTFPQSAEGSGGAPQVGR